LANLQPAVHRTILVVDVEGFGDRRRTNAHQVAVRDGLYRVLQLGFQRAGIQWSACDHEDRGDAVFVLAPADVPKAPFVESLPAKLIEAIREHNAAHAEAEQIRLRMALHAGEVYLDDHGATGASINLAFRLSDANQLKIALAKSPGVLAIGASAWFYDEVIRHSPASNPSQYHQVRIGVKETDTDCWICLPDAPYLVQESYSTTQTIVPSSMEIFFAVVEALESVPCMRTEDTRQLLIEQLRPAIASAVRYYPQRRAHVVSIVRTCLDYQGGLHELLAAISGLEQDGSMPVQRLVDVLRWSGHVTHPTPTTISPGPGKESADGGG
jgi:class 3 adenylate cyclase